ncbi:hypothetical protein Angca_004158 [Angiostrongylus cantonensis]|nr:hypothetical protein Angca_004158 [Angiostrongylus cantonensis]
MDMVVHFSDREIILFSFWKTGTLSGMAVSMLITFLLCILYEAVKGFRLFLAYCHLKVFFSTLFTRILYNYSNSRGDLASQDSLPFAPILQIAGLPRRVFSGFRLVQAALFGVQSLLAYVLMLIVMTFNGNLILSVVLGEAVGYLLFTGTPFLDAYVLDCC